ncbi:MAG: exodeoxyribonuclease VII small subunit [Gammaproteobacteria bacterium]|nr:exodeoxyribonuclease VII small subunit [Gammaproteobacteria bacterium]
MSDTPSIKDLEKNLDELGSLVEKLESGDLSLDDALKQFERGIALTRQAQAALQAAEQKVQVLMANGQLSDLDEASN